MDDIKKKIKKNIDALLEKAKEADDVAAQKVIKLLAETRDQVITSLASTDWQIYYLPQKKAAVERALNEFGRKFGVVVTEAQSNGWKLGIDMVDLPIKSANIYAAIPEINTQALTVFHDFGLDKVAGLTADGIKAINNEISLGLIGNKSFFEVTQAIAKDQYFKAPSIFKSTLKRAETIVRNEAGRALEKASQERKMAAAKVVRGLKKQWYYGHTAMMPRLEHMKADGQIRDVDKPFDIDGDKLMYPRDPAGRPDNTINCKCSSLPYHEAWEKVKEEVNAANNIEIYSSRY